MASLGHIAVGLATARVYAGRAPAKSLVKSALVFSALSMLPDADVVAFALGIPYEHAFGHRGAAHSLAFALVCAVVAWAVSKRLGLEPLQTAVATLVAVGSHPLLDTLTTGGLGCALFWPFSDVRYFAPVRPIPVAPIGLGMLSARGLFVVVFELVMFSPLLMYAVFPRRGRGETAPVLAASGMALVLGLVGLAVWWRREEPPSPPPAYVVTVSRDGAGVATLEAEVAEPIEKALSSAQRTRTRIGGGAVRVEAWGTPLVRDLPPGATLTRTSDAWWLVRGARPSGAVCGAEEPMPHVRIDPLRLAALHVGALDVENAVRALPLEELEKLPVGEQVRIADVAVVQLSPPPARCTVEAGSEPGWLVRAPKLEGATRLVSRIELAASGALKLGALAPAAITREAPSRVTLWFTEPYDAAKALAELREHEVRYLDGMKQTRLVFSGPDLEQLQRIAAAMQPKLSRAQLVVMPAAPVPRIDVKVDAERTRQLGIAPEDVEALATLALRGREHAGVRVTVELAEREHLAALFIGPQRIGELVSISQTLEPAELLRENRRRAVEVVAYGLEKKDVPLPTLPPGVSLELYGER